MPKLSVIREVIGRESGQCDPDGAVQAGVEG